MMMDRIEELRRLRPIMTNIVGFHELMDEQDTNATPERRRMRVYLGLAIHRRQTRLFAPPACQLRTTP
jgi:hypothetical protein